MGKTKPRVLDDYTCQLYKRLSLRIRHGTSFTSIVTLGFNSFMVQSVVSTALPTIVQDLGGNDFIWVGSAYALAGTAVVPMCGGLVSIWGRKPILLFLMTMFAIGSAVSGSAKSMNVLIIGRGTAFFYSSITILQ
jgi:MFS family permease